MKVKDDEDLNVLTLKTCRDCGEGKSASEFHAHNATKDRLQLYCKSCMGHRNTKWRSRNKDKLQECERNRPKRTPEERRRQQLWREYKILPEQYDKMLREQSGLCAICGTDNPGAGRTLMNVDHDHSTGDVRGLLCMGCNVALGHMSDDVDRLRSAIKYLTRGAAE